ncbi:MAG: alpha-hydroxy acid oxidase [Pseudomonadota bacterium]
MREPITHNQVTRDHSRAPDDGFQVLHEFIGPAKARLRPETWTYLMGAAETETTHLRNRLALDQIAFRPRILRNVETVDTSTTLFGHTLKLPVILAPIGSMQDLVDDGGIAPTRAAARFGAYHMLSSVSAPGLEAVARSVDYPKIFQLYVRGDSAWVDEQVQAAIDHGYVAVCLTVDLDHYGRRERDLANRTKPTARQAATSDHFQARFTWDDVWRIRNKFDVPLILKGLATPEDARIAVEYGINAIYISNHGGRQLDHGRGSMEVLSEISAEVGGRAQIIIDGGFMRGTDIVKAIALGAHAVGLGRLQGLAAAAAGEDGIVRMLDILHDEVTRTLGLLGINAFSKLSPSYVTRSQSLGRYGLDAAFPLLREGY